MNQDIDLIAADHDMDTHGHPYGLICIEQFNQSYRDFWHRRGLPTPDEHAENKRQEGREKHERH